MNVQGVKILTGYRYIMATRILLLIVFIVSLAVVGSMDFNDMQNEKKNELTAHQKQRIVKSWQGE